jgi:hypothetical protein
MNIHKNARLTPLRREEMALSVIEGVFSKAHAARIYGVSPKIVARGSSATRPKAAKVWPTVRRGPTSCRV